VKFDELNFSVGRHRRDIFPSLNIHMDDIFGKNSDSGSINKNKNQNSGVGDIDDDDIEADLVNYGRVDINLDNYYSALSQTQPTNSSYSSNSSSSNLHTNPNSSTSVRSSNLTSNSTSEKNRIRTRSQAKIASKSSSVLSPSKNTENSIPVRRSTRLHLSSSLSPSLDDVYYDDRQGMNALAKDETKNQHIVGVGIFEPKSYREAMNCQDSLHWSEGCDEEMDSLRESGTLIIQPLPDGANVIDSKWVFKVKLNSDGTCTVARYKCRVVAKGFGQVSGVDFVESNIYAPVVRFKSLKIILSLANSMDYEIEQLDVVSAFLNAPINEVVFMNQPDGYHVGGPKMVCRLSKAIYGTRQASANWNCTFNDFVVNILKFRRLSSDSCVYVKISKSGRAIYLTVFVDDIVVCFHITDLEEWTSYKNLFEKRFKIKNLGAIHWLLGIEITRNRPIKQLKFSHRLYLETLLKKFNLFECKGESTPEAAGVKLSKSYSPVTPEQIEQMKQLHNLYLSGVGSLSYTALSIRPDLSHAVNELSRFMSNPGVLHFRASKRVLRYVKNSLDVELTFDGNIQKQNLLTVYTDASWGDDADDKRSTTGYLVKSNSDTITWNSRRQTTIALSTCESEYMALAAGAQECIYIHNFLQELKIQTINTILCDNVAAISLSSHDSNHNKSKHIALKFHFIREKIKQKLFTLKWIDTRLQLADVFTKNIGKLQFTNLINKIMNIKNHN
jgi:hypothetical protein